MTSSKVRQQHRRLSTSSLHGYLQTKEHHEQRALISLCQLHENRYPGLELIFHVPNEGKRGKAEAGILAALGLKRGVPDLCLPVARRGWFGLYIEMKRRKNSHATVEQKWWRAKLSMQGYMCVIIEGCEVAWHLIEWYMKGDMTVPNHTPEQLPVDIIQSHE